MPGSGSVLAGRYLLQQLLGRGGMGEVYEAVHIGIPRRFAIKLLRADYAQEPEMRARFRLEAAAASSLISDHIVQVLDFGDAEDGSPYLVMELLLGCNLRRALKQRGPFAIAEAVDVVMQACAGVQAAHDQQIVHRDLKPENLFLARDGLHYTTKLLDFGVAKLRDQSTGTAGGKLLGTPAYMSPEQARAEEDVDARTDVHALGAILYEALTGRLPHPGEAPHEIITHLLFKEPEPVARWNSQVPSGLAKVVHKALRPARADRYPSAAALRSALAPFARARGAAPVVLGDSQETLPAQDSELRAAGAARPAGIAMAGSVGRARRALRALAVAAAGLTITTAAALSWAAWRPPPRASSGALAAPGASEPARLSAATSGSVASDSASEALETPAPQAAPLMSEEPAPPQPGWSSTSSAFAPAQRAQLSPPRVPVRVAPAAGARQSPARRARAASGARSGTVSVADAADLPSPVAQQQADRSLPDAPPVIAGSAEEPSTYEVKQGERTIVFKLNNPFWR